MSSSAPPGEVVEGPVERAVGDLERVLRDEFFLCRQQLRHDEGDHRALDRAARGKRGGRLVGVGRDEFLLAPREDRADRDDAVLAIDRDALRAGDALGGDVGELLLETRARERLAAQAAAACGAAPEPEVDARIVKAGEDRLLDLIEASRCGPPRGASAARTRRQSDGCSWPGTL
jgi:hypothetical protein